jgi:hypothetical protein
MAPDAIASAAANVALLTLHVGSGPQNTLDNSLGAHAHPTGTFTLDGPLTCPQTLRRRRR